MKQNHFRFTLLSAGALASVFTFGLARANVGPAQSQNPSERALNAMSSYFATINSEFQTMTQAEFRAKLQFRDAKGNLHGLVNEDDGPTLPWAHKDLAKDGIPGTSTERAYAELQLKSPEKPVLVAVVDSGVDVQHEDLQGRIAINEAEKAGTQGTDNDHNGFVGDVYGWNFLGGKDGRNVTTTTLEVTRELARLTQKQKTGTLTEAEVKYMAAVKADYDKQVGEKKGTVESYQQYLTQLQTAVDYLRTKGLTEETVEAVRAIPDDSPTTGQAKAVALNFISQGATTAMLKNSISELNTQIDTYYLLDDHSRDVVGDNPDVMDDIGYGNSDVTTKTADHGTHCSGIIGAVRGNGIGIDGQAEWVRILPVRAVPDGDERDKDVANAVRYAVDRGAQIISMSFGKAYSPNKDYVDAAFRYAAAHNVLVVHAAGNDNLDKDSVLGATPGNFPSRMMNDGTQLENFLEVGASTMNPNEGLPAFFSDFGQTTVDLFAPGFKILSTTPNNTYQAFSGTSMATPEVAGIAALVLSQFPSISAVDLRRVLMESATTYKGLQVNLPDGDPRSSNPTRVDFATLSITGGVANAMAALNSAAHMKTGM